MIQVTLRLYCKQLLQQRKLLSSNKKLYVNQQIDMLWLRARYRTGAMYSSVPTNEFDGVEGSETNEGGINSLDLLRFSDVECFITCRRDAHYEFYKNILFEAIPYKKI